MRDVARSFVAAVVAGVGWLTMIWLIFVEDVGSGGLASATGLSAILLFVAVPMFSFLPMQRRWQAPFFAIEAAVGWGASAVMLSFVAPAQSPPMWQVLLLLAPLTIAVATVCTALAHVAARRLSIRDDAPSFVDSRRRGYLASLGCVALTMLAGLGVVTPIMTILLITVCVLVESIITTSGRRRQVPADPRRSTRGLRSIQGS
jgi:hypothetical protein